MASNIAVADFSGSSVTVKTTDNAGVHTHHHIVDSGTIAATQSGTWTVLPGNTANTTAWLITGTGGTFPITDSGGSITVDNGGTFAVQAVCTNAGTFAVQAAQSGTWTVNLAASVKGTAGTPASEVLTIQGVTSMTAIKTDGSAVTQPVSGTFWQATQPVSLTSTTITGTVAVTKSGTWDITNAGTFAVQPGVSTTGGESSLSALSTAAVYTAEVKGSAGQIYGVEIFNKGASPVYARLYNQTGAPGSGDGANIIWRGIVPGSATGAGFVKGWPNGKICTTGIGIRVSGAIADNDTTALAANEVTINCGYK